MIEVLFGESESASMKAARNNIELDVKIKCIEQNKPQSKIAEEMDLTYVKREE